MKENKKGNYLEKVPLRNKTIRWSTDGEQNVTLEIENKGVFNRIAQKLFKKPPVSYIHLDKIGSFVWPLIDGKMSIEKLAEKVDEHFGEEALPLYERLAKYFQILESYSFISWNEE